MAVKRDGSAWVQLLLAQEVHSCTGFSGTLESLPSCLLPSLHYGGISSSISPSSSLLTTQTDTQSTWNLNRKHSDILFQNENVPKARESLGGAVTGGPLYPGAHLIIRKSDAFRRNLLLESSDEVPGIKRMNNDQGDRSVDKCLTCILHKCVRML